MDKRCKLLLVDDSEDDVWLFQRALTRHPKMQCVGRAENGEEAMHYLSGTGKFADRNEYPWPDVIILDLKMPRRNGFELLEWMRGKDGMPKVAVFSSSDLPEDRERAAKLGAALYQPKTYEAAEFDRFMQEVLELWDGA